MEGWIKLHSKFLEWEWIDDPKMVSLFLHLLLKANYRANNWKGTQVKRGQMVAGLKALNKTTGISIQSLRTCIGRLKSTGEITVQSTNKFSVITICNYDRYQQLPTGNQQSTNNQLTTPIDNIDSKEDIKGEFATPPISKFSKFIKFFNDVKKVETGTLGKFTTANQKAKRQFTALLKNYGFAEIDAATKSMFRDKFHRESGYKYATPELLTRPEKFERFLENS